MMGVNRDKRASVRACGQLEQRILVQHGEGMLDKAPQGVCQPCLRLAVLVVRGHTRSR